MYKLKPNVATDVIDKVATGDIADVVTDIDNAIDDTITDTITGTVTDVVPMPEPTQDYSMSLAEFFPFCIPFDIYNLLTCFIATPEAPRFEIPFLWGNNVIVDLSEFNSVASVLRTIETLLFCIGLAYSTNKLIKH